VYIPTNSKSLNLANLFFLLIIYIVTLFVRPIYIRPAKIGTSITWILHRKKTPTSTKEPWHLQRLLFRLSCLPFPAGIAAHQTISFVNYTVLNWKRMRTNLWRRKFWSSSIWKPNSQKFVRDRFKISLMFLQVSFMKGKTFVLVFTGLLFLQNSPQICPCRCLFKRLFCRWLLWRHCKKQAISAYNSSSLQSHPWYSSKYVDSDLQKPKGKN